MLFDQIGYVALSLALGVSLYGMIVGAWSAKNGNRSWQESARRGIYIVTGLVAIASAALVYALASDDFTLRYVVTHTERNLPLLYKLAAFWGGQAGSILFWILVLGIYASIAARQLRRQNQALAPYVLSILHGVLAFFLILSLFAANPFRIMNFVVSDGQGLDPLLQNYWMVIHPIGLYFGYVGFTIPFAYAMAALISGRLGNAWLKIVRRWALVAWVALTFGIIMGSQWAYIELSWGGFWGWDPVENASLIPWLTGTAFLHSLIIQERRGMLKVWNLLLIFLTFWLTIVGTFLTRSGVIESVHAFAISNIGPILFAFIVFLVVSFLALLFWRWPQLQSEQHLDALLSRETSFLYNNLLFLVIAFATLLGTIWPMVSEMVLRDKLTVSAPFFDKVDGPAFLLLLILMAAGALLSWRRTSWSTLVHQFRWPLVCGVIAMVVGLVANEKRPWLLATFFVLALNLAAVLQEYILGMLARRHAHHESVSAALWRLFQRNPRRYGGYLVHIGIIVIATAIVFQHNYQLDREVALMPGQNTTIGQYTLTYEGLRSRTVGNHQEIYATLQMQRNGHLVGILRPKRNLYFKGNQPVSEVALHTTLKGDLYAVLAGWENGGRPASFSLYFNPLMIWLWIGGYVALLGSIVAIWPFPRGRLAAAAVSARAPVRRVEA